MKTLQVENRANVTLWTVFDVSSPLCMINLPWCATWNGAITFTFSQRGQENCWNNFLPEKTVPAKQEIHSYFTKIFSKINCIKHSGNTDSIWVEVFRVTYFDFSFNLSLSILKAFMFLWQWGDTRESKYLKRAQLNPFAHFLPPLLEILKYAM